MWRLTVNGCECLVLKAKAHDVPLKGDKINKCNTIISMFWITCFIYPVLNKCIYYTFIAWTALKLNDQLSNMWMLFIYFQIWDFEHCESEEKNKMEEVKEVGVKKKKRRRAEGKYFSLSLGDVFSLISDFLFCFFFTKFITSLCLYQWWPSETGQKKNHSGHFVVFFVGSLRRTHPRLLTVAFFKWT